MPLKELKYFISWTLHIIIIRITMPTTNILLLKTRHDRNIQFLSVEQLSNVLFFWNDGKPEPILVIKVVLEDEEFVKKN